MTGLDVTHETKFVGDMRQTTQEAILPTPTHTKRVFAGGSAAVLTMPLAHTPASAIRQHAPVPESFNASVNVNVSVNSTLCLEKTRTFLFLQ